MLFPAPVVVTRNSLFRVSCQLLTFFSDLSADVQPSNKNKVISSQGRLVRCYDMTHRSPADTETQQKVGISKISRLSSSVTGPGGRWREVEGELREVEGGGGRES